jgi:hypothetical protein
MSSNDSKKAIPETSAETHAIASRLRVLAAGQTITYVELNALFPTAFDVQGRNRHNLEAAKRKVLNDDGIVVECVFNVGVKRLTDSEKLAIGPQVIQRTRRIAKRGLKKLATTDTAQLHPEERRELLTQQSLIGAIVCCTEPSLGKRVAAKIQASPQRISFGEIPKA